MLSVHRASTADSVVQVIRALSNDVRSRAVERPGTADRDRRMCVMEVDRL